MANICNVYGNVPTIKLSYKKVLGLGEGMVANEWIMKFQGNENIRYLVQTAQFPGLQRANVETRGPYGVMFKQQGWYQNAQDINVSFKETIKGHFYAFLRDWVKNKKYLEVRLAAAGESFLQGNANAAVRLEDCWLECDAFDLDYEGDTTLVKPSGTLHANWVSWCDDDVSGGMGLSYNSLP